MFSMKKTKLAIVGTVGVPACYGGFETLVENLLDNNECEAEIIVFCSKKNYETQLVKYKNASLYYIPIAANGISSVIYDIWSLFYSVFKKVDYILLLGVSGALCLPVIRLISKAKIVTNIDGIEWQRDKWRGVARHFLRLSELFAVRYSHEIVADNEGIANYVRDQYGCACHVIAYGGDHALASVSKPYEGLPESYALALCRIEPENNVAMILEAFLEFPDVNLVFIGNWNGSAFGQKLRQRYQKYEHMKLLDPIYDLGVLRTIRENAGFYLHGHSAGGTNPSLVEMMYFSIPIIAYDCAFNRFTTEEKAMFFVDVGQLRKKVTLLVGSYAQTVGDDMREIALRRYSWEVISKEYFKLLRAERR